MFRLIGVIIRLAVLLALAFVALVAWGNFWPRPHGAPHIACTAGSHPGCRMVAGRVLYHTGFGPGRRAHVVLMSRSSVTLPGIVALEFPPVRRTPGGLGIGDWIAVLGLPETGSHHEHDLHVIGFATSTVTVRCGGPSNADACRTFPHRRR